MLSYFPNGRFLVQKTFPKTLPRFVLILISLQRWQHRVRNEPKHLVSPHLIGRQFLANQHETNQHKSAVLIGLLHATSTVLLSVESYRNYRKPTQRGIQGYLSSLQWRVMLSIICSSDNNKQNFGISSHLNDFTNFYNHRTTTKSQTLSIFGGKHFPSSFLESVKVDRLSSIFQLWVMVES